MTLPLSDTEVLSKAQRLLDKYFHPSRSLGKVPSPGLAGQLADAKTLLAAAENRARREETEVAAMPPTPFEPPGSALPEKDWPPAPDPIPQWPGI